jgi:hypothetical protein
MNLQPIQTDESGRRAAAAPGAARSFARRPWRRAAVAPVAALLAALPLALVPLAVAGGPEDSGRSGGTAAGVAGGAGEPGRSGEPGEPGEPEGAAEPGERRIERVIVRAPRIRVEGREGVQAHVLMVGSDGEPVRLEVEPDGEGGFHWVERGEGGEVVAVRPLDEIAASGEPRVRAVFIGDREAAPFAVECGPGEEAGDCPPGFHFGYHFLDPEGMGARRGYLGAALTELSSELRAHFGAPEDAGVLVARVEPDSPAAAGGLAVGDVITAIDGDRVAGGFDLRRRVRAMDDGERATLEVIRGGRVLALTVTVAEREQPEVDLRRFLWRGPGAGGRPDEPFVYHLDPEALNEAVVELKERFAAPEIRRDVVRLRGAEGELERRIVELEQRIAELEGTLEREAPPEE